MQLNSWLYTQKQKRYKVYDVWYAALGEMYYMMDYTLHACDFELKNSAADLSKKYLTISFHVVYEALAAGILKQYRLKGIM